MKTTTYFSPRQAAALSGFSPTVILTEIRAGRLKALRGASWYKIPVPALEAWLSRRYNGDAVRFNPERGELEFHEEGTLVGV
jgi:hypothetical protein